MNNRNYLNTIIQIARQTSPLYSDILERIYYTHSQNTQTDINSNSQSNIITNLKLHLIIINV